MSDGRSVFDISFKSGDLFSVVSVEAIVSADPDKTFFILGEAAHIILGKAFFNGNVTEPGELGIKM
jgi:hypothetical protein